MHRTVFAIVCGNSLFDILNYDTVGRLASIGLSGTGTPSYNVGWSFTRNPASQIASETRDNDIYAWDGQPTSNQVTDYTVNGLNQYSAVESNPYTYDANGNLTADGERTYLYDHENRLVTASGTQSVELSYDPLGRLWRTVGSTNGTTYFLWDGDALAMEYSASGTVLRRYIHGADFGMDDPLIAYEGAGLGATVRRNLHADPRGSIVLVTNATGAIVRKLSYDEYGMPETSNNNGTMEGRRFQYTGQLYLADLGMYHYKARIYSPVLGRFLQTDPIGYKDQVNLYAYVGNDPVNLVDPTGTQSDTVMDRRNQAFLVAMAECRDRGPECAAAYVEGMAVAVIAIDFLTIPSGEGPIIAKALYHGTVALLGKNAGRAALRSLGLKTIRVSDTQFGKKFGQHAAEWGIRSGDTKAFRDLIHTTTRNADRVVPGVMSEGRKVLFWVRGGDVVATTRKGDFITIMKGAAGENPNPSVARALAAACQKSEVC